MRTPIQQDKFYEWLNALVRGSHPLAIKRFIDYSTIAVDLMFMAWKRADWTGDIENLLKLQNAMPQQIALLPDALQKEFWEFRVRFIEEELNELKAAQTPALAVDAIIDMMVVALGTLACFGVDVREAWDRVYKANIAKVPGENPTRPNPFGLPDLIKPEGWTAPNHDDNVGFVPVGSITQTRDLDRF